MLSQRESPGTVCSGAALGLFLKLLFLLGFASPAAQTFSSRSLPAPFVFYLPAGSSWEKFPWPPSWLSRDKAF